MKPALEVRSVLSSGGGETRSFGISDRPEDLAQLFWILRDALYTNKILAVLREYSANAWDAHRDAGKADVPIKVVLPTFLDPAVVIRDYGSGLSEEDIDRIYTKYGASTKREDDLAVGMLGIGSKSAFAYNDTFTVTSWYGGMKKMYHAVLDETNIGYIMKMYEEECSPEETGIEVKVPVNPNDISRFQREAGRLFCYFRPLPVINIALSEPSFDWKTEHGFLRKNHYKSRHEDQWQAVMGCVPYRLNLDQIWDLLTEAGLDRLATSLSGGLYFEIGDVMVSANREELQYTERTKKAIIEKFNQVIEELVHEVTAIIENEEMSFWDRRLKLHEFVSTTGMPLAREYREAGWGLHHEALLYRAKTDLENVSEADGDEFESEDAEGLPKSFRLKVPTKSTSYSAKKKHYLKEDARIPISPKVRLLIKDVIKSYRGYVDTDYRDLVITIREGYSVEQVEKELGEFLLEAKLSGVLVKRMSDMTYRDYGDRSGSVDKVMAAKHTNHCFVLKNAHDYGTRSRNWEIQDREEDEDDVYVVLNRFVPTGHFTSNDAKEGAPFYPRINGDDFYRKYRNHRQLLTELFNETMPTIWGLKTTQNKPLRRDTLVGTPYEVWIYKVLTEALARSPEVKADLDSMGWAELKVGSYTDDPEREEVKIIEWLKPQLDGRHAILRFLRDRVEGSKRWRELAYKKKESLQILVGIVQTEKTQAQRRYDLLVERYPLLKFSGSVNGLGLGAFTGSGREEWLRYVNLIDTYQGK